MSANGALNPALIGAVGKAISMSNPVSAALSFAPSVLKGIGSMFSSGSKNKNQQKLLEMELANRLKLGEMEDRRARDLADQNTASEESMANPFRHQVSQGRSALSLDAMERANFSPAQVTGGSSRYAGNKPTISGGFNYEISPELRAAAASLKASVLRGETAPTMTNPANYGRTAALQLDPATGLPIAQSAGAAGVDLGEDDGEDVLGMLRRRRGRSEAFAV